MAAGGGGGGGGGSVADGYQEVVSCKNNVVAIWVALGSEEWNEWSASGAFGVTFSAFYCGR